MQAPRGQAWFTAVAAPMPVDLRPDVAHSARIYDYFLDGKDNFPADREAAKAAEQAFPGARTAARQNRQFLIRAVRHLAGEVGIRQYLDIGTGIPTSPNLHEVAQGIVPEARVVYADNDPIVLAHARALLTSTSHGRTAYLDADIREPDRILAAPELRETLDLTRPVALSLIAMAHFIPDEDDPFGVVRRLVDALPAGSALALTYFTADINPDDVNLSAAIYRRQGISLTPRPREEILRFFEGFDLVDPGLVMIHRWRPDGRVPDDITDGQVNIYGGVGLKRQPAGLNPS